MRVWKRDALLRLCNLNCYDNSYFPSNRLYIKNIQHLSVAISCHSLQLNVIHVVSSISLRYYVPI